jgi:hypothetical protein
VRRRCRTHGAAFCVFNNSAHSLCPNVAFCQRCDSRHIWLFPVLTSCPPQRSRLLGHLLGTGATMAKLNARYVRDGTVPRKLKYGYVLCHNHMMHTDDMPCGVGGFRAWFNPEGPPTDFIECRCGWSGMPHYAYRARVRSKCATWYQIARRALDYTPGEARQFERLLKRLGPYQIDELFKSLPAHGRQSASSQFQRIKKHRSQWSRYSKRYGTQSTSRFADVSQTASRAVTRVAEEDWR